MPVNLNVGLTIKSSNRFFQPSFADVAPRTDHGGNHINNKLHRRFSFIGKSRSSLP